MLSKSKVTGDRMTKDQPACTNNPSKRFNGFRLLNIRSHLRLS